MQARGRKKILENLRPNLIYSPLLLYCPKSGIRMFVLGRKKSGDGSACTI